MKQATTQMFQRFRHSELESRLVLLGRGSPSLSQGEVNTGHRHKRRSVPMKSPTIVSRGVRLSNSPP
jgi:hypothetical protein